MGSKTPLTEDVSRSELLRYANSLDPGIRTFPRRFEFPTDIIDRGIFGIDISHHQGAVKWKRLLGNKVSFVYVKATQGQSYYDPRFAQNWKSLATARSDGAAVHRGAYHFLSANTDAAAQAKNFVEVVGPLGPDDLPPCLDLEWDFERANGAYVLDDNGKYIDRWSKLTSGEIIEKVKLWLEAVEQATGKKPIIYTNTHWWKSNIGPDLALAGFQLWISDYSKASLRDELPRYPDGHTWVIWQLTDQGRVPSASIKSIDVNIYPGTMEEFQSWCCNAPVAAPP
jgi:lysozyme